jgi:hypothetical protein
MACQDWANTKAAYRFLSNERVSEDSIHTIGLLSNSHIGTKSLPRHHKVCGILMH